ncbi:MAG: DUF3365 domain-containing protein [Chromatiales bacterium]|nr:DUF3365 domain-containing protein [Chromatiales bacterium]
MSVRIAQLMLLLGLISPGLAAAGETSKDAAERAEEAAALVDAFRDALMSALLEGLQQGAAAAVEVCSDQAPALAVAAAPQGVRLGRTSHRLRNPDNLPPEWAEPLLAACAAGEDCTPRLVRIGEDRSGWIEPIFTPPMCLACHGSNLSADVQAELDLRYPEDQATGFAAGEFRGLFWVEMTEPRK